MAKQIHPEARGRAVVPKADGNPEGKGLNRIQSDWYASEPRNVVAKSQRQILAEFFTSMLVLSAQFRYQPVAGDPNYLYWIDGEWTLSLVSPTEWSTERYRGFAGTCVLQDDRTWTISPSELLAEDNAVSRAVAGFYDAFAEMMDTDLELEQVLPFYVAKMPYYQRLNANALSRSIRDSVKLGEQMATPCREWRLQLPRLSRLLPASV
ncbi:MAG: hypothetical protein QNJ07_13770 [Woeseiaceae bacterium]|nr:hypothetical protein [Woeseiaceae bacterium]